MRNNTIRAFALGIITGSFMTAAAVAAIPQAKADPDNVSVAYAAHYGAAVCETLDEYPSNAGIIGIGEAIVDDGLTWRQAGYVIAISVEEICPRHHALIMQFANNINGWGRDISGFDAPIVHGVGLVYHYLGNDIDTTRLYEALLEIVPAQLKAQAVALRQMTTGTTPKLVAIAVMSLYNRRPGKRILVSTRTFGASSRNAHSVATNGQLAGVSA